MNEDVGPGCDYVLDLSQDRLRFGLKRDSCVDCQCEHVRNRPNGCVENSVEELLQAGGVFECPFKYFDAKENMQCKEAGYFEYPGSRNADVVYFLSHRGPDSKHQLVYPLYLLLEELGVKCFLDLRGYRVLGDDNDQGDESCSLWMLSCCVHLLSWFQSIQVVCS